MGAGKDHGIDFPAAVLLEKRKGGAANILDRNLLSGQLRFGEAAPKFELPIDRY